MLLEASAPGSLMLLGEYGVLYGKPAVVCAVDKRITVRLIPRRDDQITIHSALGQLSTTRSEIALSPPFKFILTVLKKFQKKMPSGCEIEIHSEFSSQIGLGSSAAVTAASLAIMNEWLQLSHSPLELARLGRTVIREVQGQGSGADVAACIFGGVVSYQGRPFTIEKLPGLHPISVVYSGSKLPTPEAIFKVENAFSHRKNLFQEIIKAIGRCAMDGKAAILKNDWNEFGKIMNIQQGLMDALGVNTEVLQECVRTLRSSRTMLGAKISGSGFGDCVVGLGSVVEGETLHAADDEKWLRVNMTERGVVCEKK